VGVKFFAGVDGDWADDPDALVAALRSDWPGMSVRPVRDSEHVAYDLEYENALGSLHADGRCIAFKHDEDLVVRLAAWWRARLPDSVRLAVFNDSTAIPVYVEPGMTADELLERVAAAEGEE
jgi:hypothetical protein